MGKQVRTKTVEMDGAKFTIAPLTLNQIEEYVAPLDAVAAMEKNFGFKKGYEVVCYGLNNAIPDSADQDEIWTEDRVKSELDLVLFERLQNEILEFSGFKLNKPAVAIDIVGIPGEPNATSGKDSSHSVVTEIEHLQPLSATSVVA